tara:strand:+ start:292 stop:1503 length:1212 start_codon:yes stop_codon:yes gene_type:complete
MKSFFTFTLRHLMTRFPILIISLLCGNAYGLPVSGIYSERVPVANESDAERKQAFKNALQIVLVRATGEQSNISHPAVQEALSNAQSYVEAFRYFSEAVTPTLVNRRIGLHQGIADSAVELTVGDSQDELMPNQGQQNATVPTVDEQRFIEVEFSSVSIEQMLTEARIPLWDSNRPSVLVWMALQDESGNRSLMSSDINSDIINLIRVFANERGLPVLFPVLDFEDRRNLNEDLVWRLDEDAIRSASLRYGADSILTGRLHFTSSEELVGLWQFQFQGETQVFDGFSTDLEAYLNAPLERVTAQLAQYFAIVPELELAASAILRVDGISDLQDYSALVAYIGGLGLVDKLATSQVSGDRLELRLGLVGDVQQLYELIALDRDLLPVASTTAVSSGLLHYRWTR